MKVVDRDFFRRRKRDYQLVFGSPAGKAVLEDLIEFCRANETCVVRDRNGKIDELTTFALEGRREVFLRINAHLNLTPEQLMDRAGAKAMETEDGEAG